MSSDFTEYITFGQIQQEKIQHYRNTGRGLSFTDAIQQLIAHDQVQHGVSSAPDFLSWNLRTDHKLMELIDQISIPISEISLVRRTRQENVTSLSTHNLIQINREACYSDGVLITVEYFCLIYCMKGSCRLITKRSEREMKRGELFILPPGLPYCVQNTPEDLVITIISPSNLFQKNFHALIYQNNPLSAFFRKSLFELRSDPVYFQLPASPEIRSLIQHLFAEFVKRDALSKIAFNDYLQVLYIHIIRSLEQMVLTIADTRRLTVMEMMPSILQYIQKNYHTVSLDSLAELFHYESSYMSKQIRLATGRTFSDIVTNLRLTEARDLLLNTRESIEHIAELVGYNSGDHFSYMFRKTYGISPMRYRQRDVNGDGAFQKTHLPIP